MTNSFFLNLWPGRQAATMVGITSLIAVFLALGTSGLSVEQISIIAVIATVHTVALLLLISLAKSLIEKVARLSWTILLIVLILIGSTRGWLIFELTEQFEPVEVVPLTTRVFNSAITITIWGFIFSLIESRLRSFKERYRKQFADRAVAIASSDNLSAIEVAKSIDGMESIQALQANLLQIASTEKELLSRSQLIGAAQRIRSEIENSLRPLSRRMWFDSAVAQPKFHIWELLKESLRSLDIRWFPAGPLISLAFFFGSLSIYKPEAVVIRVSLYGVALSLLLYLLQRNKELIQHSTIRGAVALFFIGITSSLVGEIGVSLALYNKLLSTDPLLAIVGPAATVGILWVEAAFAQMRKDWNIVAGAVDDADADARSKQDVISSRFAGYLHNSLQSQLAGIALALENTDPSDSAQVRQLMDRLRTISTKSIGSDFASLSTSPIERIATIAEAWKGIANVNYSIPDELLGNPKIEIVVEIVEEAINNAVRHAQAKEISIVVDKVADGLQVEISHHVRSHKSGKARLGQLWLERFSQDHSVKVTPDGVRHLTVTV